MITKPMLAGTLEDISKLKYPVWVTPKLDGIRCLKIDGKAVSRKFKPIPNNYVRTWIETHCPDGFDGEIICPGKTFNETQSLIMTEEGTPDFQYVVFDYVKETLRTAYLDRMNYLLAYFMAHGQTMNFAAPLFPKIIINEILLKDELDLRLSRGYEGIMIRSGNGPYKCGRSTLREGFLLKLKVFADSEATVVGFEERLHNNNEAKTDELGHTKRSSHKANLVPAGTLGNLLVKDIKTGVEFGIGTGMDDALRLEIWNNQQKYLGKIVNYQHQPFGEKDKPRFPSFRGFRDERDL